MSEDLLSRSIGPRPTCISDRKGVTSDNENLTAGTNRLVGRGPKSLSRLGVN